MRLPRFRSRRDLVCREAVELMTAYLDGALRASDRARLEAHLTECPNCAEYLRQLRVTVELLGEVGPEDLDDETVEEFVGLYRRWRSG